MEDHVRNFSDLDEEERNNTEGTVNATTTDGAFSSNAHGTDDASVIAKTATQTKLFKSPKKLVRKQKEDAMKIACQYLKNKTISKATNSRPATPQPTSDDECTTYGHLIAQKLRRMDYYERQVVMNDINGVIFKHVMKHRTNPISAFPTTATSPMFDHSSTPSLNSPLSINTVHSPVWSQPPSPISNYSFPTSPSSLVPNYSVPEFNSYAQSSSHTQFTDISQSPTVPQLQSSSARPFINMSQSFNTSSRVNDSNVN